LRTEQSAQDLANATRASLAATFSQFGEARLERSISSNPTLWPTTLTSVAIERHGIFDERHPVVLRAHELIPGLPTYYDRLIDLHGYTPERASATYQTLINATPPGVPSAPRVAHLGGEQRPVPPNWPANMPSLELQIVHLGGHPALPRDRQAVLHISGILRAGMFLFQNARAADPIAVLDYARISQISVEGPDTVESRVTLPRLAVGGVLAPAFKKRQARSYLIATTHDSTEVILEVRGRDPWSLRAELSPLLNWINPTQAAVAS
jgi:hypothetical protein